MNRSFAAFLLKVAMSLNSNINAIAIQFDVVATCNVK